MSYKHSQKRDFKERKRRLQKRNPLIPLVFIALGAILIVVFFTFRPKAFKTAPDYMSEVNGAPRLKADQERIDFGDVKVGEWVSASFTLKNVGDEPLRFMEKPYIEVLEGC